MLAEANMLLCSIGCVVVGYLIGSISFGYLVGKKKKIDIANQGSGNLGATNALRTTGIRGGLATLSGDLLKALIPALLVKFWLFKGMEGNAYGLYSTEYFVLLTGLAVVLGHDFPFWRKFKGGKGMASSGGTMLVLNFPMSFVLLIMMIFVVATTKYVSLASILAAVFINIGMLICFPGQWVLIGLVFVYAVLAVWSHRSNISRLLQGKENKISFKKK